MTFRSIALAAVGLSVLAGPAMAQNYPTRPVTMVVPFAAGGPTDTVARLIAQSMSQTLGQQVVVENVGGAGGTLGAGRVAKAEPDGYTVLLHHIGQATSATLYRKLPYKTLEDFQTVGLVTDVPMTIVARKDFPAKDMKELVEYVKANKDKVTLANAGVGSASHLCGMLFQDAIKTQLTTVPYKGTGPAMNDLVGSQVDLMCDQTTNTTGQIKGNAIKAYAVTTKDRLASLGDLPTVAEAGLAGMTVGVWHGVYAPKGTPAPVVEKLSGALQTALADQTVIARFAELGTTPEPKERATPAAHDQHLRAEIARWKPIIEAAGTFAD
ncbi:tripartite tricarboxylate transporter substrate binding protein BugD [Arenibaculum pallidiluteum]|uniref:tripartite tricarboxylate transporter substrate binding protein BugD n=1 Tax=Arenibaculum pallidiluteum TaxID=2812559 RepID=UPI001A95AE62|nr:tripartite tricarboxylate transporter substrate binding protein BugD [Arenibaculum pallidiluteum]